MASNQPLMANEPGENDPAEKLLAGESFVSDEYAVLYKRKNRWLPKAVVPLLLAFFVLYSISLVLLVKRSMPHCQSRDPNEIIYCETN